MIVLAKDAPPWAHDFARQLDLAIATARLGPFVSFQVYDATGDLPDPAKHYGKAILITGAASGAPAAVSDGADWIDTTGAAL